MRIRIALLLALTSPPALAARNVVLFVGDGMGQAQVTAARVKHGPTVFDEFPHTAIVKTSAADRLVPDSAAAATAFATGVKVSNGVLSFDGAPIPTIAEIARKSGRSVGLVTTAEIVDAIPAAFYAHVKSRRDYAAIATQLLASGFDLALGGGARHFDLSRLRSESKWNLVTTGADLGSARLPLLGLFAPELLAPRAQAPAGEPSLAEMALRAVELLSKNPKGFFLLVENEQIDERLHSIETAAAIDEVKVLSDAVRALLPKLDLTRTLLLAVGDHETGGLAVLGESAFVQGGGTEHTTADVTLFANGATAERVHGTIDNTELFRILTRAMGL
jgi:alkaline phosphatase